MRKLRLLPVTAVTNSAICWNTWSVVRYARVWYSANRYRTLPCVTTRHVQAISREVSVSPTETPQRLHAERHSFGQSPKRISLVRCTTAHVVRTDVSASHKETFAGCVISRAYSTSSGTGPGSTERVGQGASTSWNPSRPFFGKPFDQTTSKRSKRNRHTFKDSLTLKEVFHEATAYGNTCSWFRKIGKKSFS